MQIAPRQNKTMRASEGCCMFIFDGAKKEKKCASDKTISIEHSETIRCGEKERRITEWEWKERKRVRYEIIS